MVRSPTFVNQLMKFARLDHPESPTVYAVGWRIEDNADDWTRRFLGFKSGDKEHVRGAALIFSKAIKLLLAHEGLRAEKTGLATALSSVRTCFDRNAPLFKVGGALAKHHGLVWMPDAFTKATHKPLRTLSKASDRDSEVKDKYVCTIAKPVEALIILDDFATRGATLAEMRRAVHASSPRIRVLGLALGKNERATYASQFGVTVSNEHIPQAWNELWTKESM